MVKQLNGFILLFIILFFQYPCLAVEKQNDAIEKYIQEGQLVKVQNLIKNGLDINSTNNRGDSLLAQAIQSKKGTFIAEWLIENGANIKYRTIYGSTALSIACWRNNKKIIKLLVKNGADINDTISPPIFECDRNVNTLKLVIELGANVNLISSGRNKVSVLEYYKSNGTSQTTLELLNNNIDVSDSRVIVNRGIKVAEKMIALGVPPDKTDENGETVLFKANNLSMIELLLSKGADPNIKSKKDGATVLIRKVRFGDSPQAVKLIMNYGGNPNIKDHNGKTAFDYANEIITKGSVTLETVKFSFDSSYERLIEDTRRKIVNKQICLDIMKSKPGGKFRTTVSDDERKTIIDKAFTDFKNLRGKKRYKEFQYLLAANFSAPSSTVGYAIDFYRSRKPYSEEEIIEQYGPFDYKDNEGNLFYYLGETDQRFYYAYFVMNRGKRTEVAIIPKPKNFYSQVMEEKRNPRIVQPSKKPADNRSMGRLSFNEIEMKVQSSDENIASIKDLRWQRQGSWDNISRVLKCGDSLDVFWHPGAVLFMRSAGILEEVFNDKEPIFADIAWDGQSVWIATIREGIWIVQPDGSIERKISQSDGLPNISKAIMLYAEKPGQVIAVGSFGSHSQAWCSRIALTEGSKVKCRVFHKATRVAQPGEKREDLEDNPNLCFKPQWLHKYDSGSNSSYLLVGRYAPSHAGRRRPLIIDLKTLKVSVFGRDLSTADYHYSDSYFSRDGNILEAGDFGVTLLSAPGQVLDDGKEFRNLCPDRPDRNTIGHQDGFAKMLLLYEGWLYAPGGTWWRFDAKTFEPERLVPWRLPMKFEGLRHFGLSAHYGLIAWGKTFYRVTMN